MDIYITVHLIPQVNRRKFTAPTYFSEAEVSMPYSNPLNQMNLDWPVLITNSLHTEGGKHKIVRIYLLVYSINARHIPVPP